MYIYISIDERRQSEHDFFLRILRARILKKTLVL